MTKPHTCSETKKFLYIYGMYIYILPYLCAGQYFHMYTIYLCIGIQEKSSNLDSSVETEVIEIDLLLKELDNGRHS